MKDLAKSSRINTALQVINHANEGMTVTDACRAIGIPRSSFYYILKNNQEAFAEVQEIERIHHLEQLVIIYGTKTELIRKLCQDALSEEISIGERVSILKALNKELDGLLYLLDDRAESKKEIHELLRQGPKTEYQESRLRIS